MKLTTGVFFLGALLFLQACAEHKKDSKELSEVKFSQDRATDFEAELPFPVYDYEGLKPLLNQDDDKTYIVNFWATWCKPCLAEMPHFQRMYAEQKANDVELILVSLDMPSMWEKRLVPYVEEKDLQGDVVILDDPKMNEWIPRVDESWGGGIPATLIYNKDKRAFYEKAFTYKELNLELEKFK